MSQVRLGDFKPSGWRLMQLVHPDFGADVRSLNEPFEIHGAVTALTNALYRKLGAERYADVDVPWPVDPAMETALRACMRDYGGEAGYQIARFLVRCGKRDAEVIAGLDPWSQLMFRLRAENMTVEQLEDLIREGGIPGGFTQAARAELRGWIARPETCLHMDSSILGALFGERYVGMEIGGSDDFPPNDKLFAALVNSVGVDPPVCDARQYFSEDYDDARLAEYARLSQGLDEATGIVAFNHGGRAYSFTFNGDWTRGDLEGVMRNAEEFLERLGRPERVFRWRANMAYWDAVADLTLADPKAFAALVERLGLPVEPSG